MLPDDVLLGIFDFYANGTNRTKRAIEAWQTLVHVCRRWRTIVFVSPRRLNLRLICSAHTPARKTLDVWPALPLVIQCYLRVDVDNIVAVLEHSNRVQGINLIRLSKSDLENVLAAMQVSFPELTQLELSSDEKTAVIPDSFLGGSVDSAPRLRFLWLKGISFPGLPKLLLAATRLVHLCLSEIPHSGYFSPKALVTALPTLTSLEELRLEFQSPQSRPDQASRRQPLPTRIVLPVLTEVWFEGVSEYFNDLVAHIDAPVLDKLVITFFNQIVFDTPQLVQFISRTPTFKALVDASVSFEDGVARVNLQASRFQGLLMKIPCRELDWQVSSVEQVFTSCLPPLFTLEKLSIYARVGWQPDWQDNIDNTLWLELLYPFTAARNLYLSKEFALLIVPALQELVGSRTTEVLPALQNVFLEGLEQSGPVQDGIGEFVVTRQVIGHPIAVSRWDRSS